MQITAGRFKTEPENLDKQNEIDAPFCDNNVAASVGQNTRGSSLETPSESTYAEIPACPNAGDSGAGTEPSDVTSLTSAAVAPPAAAAPFLRLVSLGELRDMMAIAAARAGGIRPLAKQLSLSPGTIGDIISRKRDPGVNVAKVFGVRVPERRGRIPRGAA